MSQQPPSDPSGEQPSEQGRPQDPGASAQQPPPPPSYPAGPAGYGQQGYPPAGYPASSGGMQLDLARIVSIGAWVVLALVVLFYLYGLGQDTYGEDVADRLFNLMPELAQGIFWSGLLHGVGVWLSRH